jgi:hypothetical protein
MGARLEYILQPVTFGFGTAMVSMVGTNCVGPMYFFFGLGLGLFYVNQGLGRGVAAINANTVRMVASAGGGRRDLRTRFRRHRILCRGRRWFLRLCGATRSHRDRGEDIWRAESGTISRAVNG